jgi:hypothetical protein
LEDVRADVPWDLQIADPLGSFPVPTEEEINFLRHLSPISSFSNAVGLELMTAYHESQRKGKAVGTPAQTGR